MDRTIAEPERQTPLAGEYDVIVVGGGPAGMGAALAAARQGAHTLIIEQFNCLGGVATAGGHAHISSYCAHGTDRQVVGGIAREIADRLADEGFGHTNAYGVWFEVEGLKLILERMALDAGIEVLYHTFFCDALVEDGVLTGVITQSKDGRQAWTAKRVVDCTGDGDVGFRAGCPWEQGREGDGACQPTTLMFTIGGVDWNRVSDARPKGWPAGQWKELWAEAQRNGDMEPIQDQIMGWWWTPSRPDWVGCNFTHITGVDSTKAADLTRATIEGRRQAWHCIDVYRRYVPGMEECFMVSTPNTVGLRESRRLMGDYVLTEDDLTGQREFDDGVCYGSFFIDIHHIDGPGMDSTTWRPPEGFKYQIPYGCLVPSGVENLLAAGRCISVTHVALGSTRVMVPCIATGEAAGVAAALSLEDGVAPRSVDVAKVRNVLRAAGGIITEEDITPYG